MNLLRKLEKRGLGLNSFEFFAKKNSGEGLRKEARRRRMVQLIMKGKREDVMQVLIVIRSKESFGRKMAKVERRWGHHRATMITFRNILTRLAEKV